MNIRSLAQQHLAPTSFAPTGLHIVGAEGCYLEEASGKKYLDLIGGISVCNLGHGHPRIKAALHTQGDKYLHVMVYGEVVQSPQAQYAAALAGRLPSTLSSIHFTNSGTEAVEGALKLARRTTGRRGIIGAKNSYHGSSTGALALMGSEYWKAPFRPLLPGVKQFDYGSEALLAGIDRHTACVVLEPVQAEAGVKAAPAGWLKAVRERCTETGTLLVFDEIQTGFGRTGTLWHFEQLGVVPDVLLLGKALGGGLPLGAFISSQERMVQLADNPVLGHISTFGGHPLCCATGLAGLEALLEEGYIQTIARKEALFHQLLAGHPAVAALRSAGLLMALQLESPEAVVETLKRCSEKGVFSDWFLFAPDCLRLAPPLVISEEQIREACTLLGECMP